MNRSGSLRRDGGVVFGDPGEMAVDVGLPGVVGRDGHVGRTEVAPALGVCPPTIGVAARVLGLGPNLEPVPRQACRLTLYVRYTMGRTK